MDGTSLIPGDGPLTGDSQADVCVIGAGVAGLTTAYLLAREGRSVLVLDDGDPGMGESLRTTAHLSAAIDDRIFVVEREHGPARARLAVQSQLAAMERIQRVCVDERMDGVFRRADGYLFLHPGDTPDTLQRELHAAHKAGLPDVRLEPSAPLPFATGPCLVFPRQAELDAGEYLAGLADAVRRMGGRIHGGTRATAIAQGPPAVVTTASGRIECEAIVVCTNSPVFGAAPFHSRQDQMRTYVVAYEVPRGAIPSGLFWDTPAEGSGYHYIRLSDRAEPGQQLLLVGGEDHRVGEGDPRQCLQRLEAWCRQRFQVETPTYRWSGQVIEPADHLPFLGRYPGLGKSVYVITGDSGQGFTNHTCGAMLVTDLIQHRRNAYQGLYRPDRKGLPAVARRARALRKARGAKAPKKQRKVTSEADIPRGMGAILRRGGVDVACFRDGAGDLHECAAACTHMGGMVAWNPLEKTWDCPLHGSRFAATGNAVNGPANEPLGAPQEPKADQVARARRHPKAKRGPTRQVIEPAGRRAQHRGRPRSKPRTPVGQR